MSSAARRTAIGLVIAAVATALFSVEVGAASKKTATFSKDRLVRALLSVREASRQKTLDRIEQQYRDVPQVADVLLEAIDRRTKKDEAPQSLLRMVRMLRHFDHPDAADTLTGLLRHKDMHLVIVALDALASGGDPQAMPHIARLAKRPEYTSSYGLRRAIFDCVVRIPDHAAVDFVIREFPKIDGLLKLDLVHYLSEVSGQHFGVNDKKWAQWWVANRRRVKFSRAGGKAWFREEQPPPKAKPAETAGPVTPAAPRTDPVASQTDEAVSGPEFFNFKIYAKRIVFVIDRSGSMRDSIGRESKLRRAKRELLGAIQVLPEDTSFNIVLFHGKVNVWQRGLVPATRKNREKAAKFIAGIRYGEWTNSYEALDASLKLDGNTEAIYFLSDGQPTQGKITNVREIVRVISRENLFRRVQINAVQIGGGPVATEFMKALAKQNGGQFREAF